MSHDNQRRTFIASVGSLAALALFKGTGGETAEAAELTLHQQNGKWDLSWLDGLKGKHRQVFDFGSRDLSEGGNPLRIPRNYLNAHREVYGLADSELNTVVGITRQSFPLNASDRLWKEYALGEWFKLRDPVTSQWAVRNYFVDILAGPPGSQPTASIQTLLSRGTIFWQCNHALRGFADELAAAKGKDAALVAADLAAGLSPWVKLVPAHTMLLGLAQERGCTYEKV